MEKREREEGGPTLKSKSESGLLSNVCSGCTQSEVPRKEAAGVDSFTP